MVRPLVLAGRVAIDIGHRRGDVTLSIGAAGATARSIGNASDLRGSFVTFLLAPLARAFELDLNKIRLRIQIYIYIYVMTIKN